MAGLESVYCSCLLGSLTDVRLNRCVNAEGLKLEPVEDLEWNSVMISGPVKPSSKEQRC